MRCRSCQQSAGLLRRLCADCERVFALYERERGELGLSQFLDRLIADGVPRAKIEAALAIDLDGGGALQDKITADMANRVLADLGHAPRHRAADVKRMREQGGGLATTTRPSGDAAPPKGRT
jgi:hypothetical protein